MPITSQSVENSVTTRKTFATNEMLEMLACAYTENISANGCPIVMIERFKDYLENGLSYDRILLAIDQTALAPRPSGRYLVKILDNAILEDNTADYPLSSARAAFPQFRRYGLKQF